MTTSMPHSTRPEFLLVAPVHYWLANGLEEGASLEAERLGCRLWIDVLRFTDPGEIWNRHSELDARLHWEGVFAGHIFVYPDRRAQALARALKAAGRRVILLPDGPEDLPTLRVDGAAAMREAVRRIVALGRTRPLYLGGSAHNFSADLRERGFREGMAAAGLPLDPDLIARADFKDDAAERVTRALLQRGVMFDAIIAANDRSARGALNVLQQRGLSTAQIPIVGYDDEQRARHSEPPIATFRFSGHRAGALAVRALFEAWKNEGPVEGRNVEPAFVWRESLGREAALLPGEDASATLLSRLSSSAGLLEVERLRELVKDLLAAAREGRLAAALREVEPVLATGGGAPELAAEVFEWLRVQPELAASASAHAADWLEAERFASAAMGRRLVSQAAERDLDAGLGRRFRALLGSGEVGAEEIATAMLRTLRELRPKDCAVWLRDFDERPEETGSLYVFEGGLDEVRVLAADLPPLAAAARFSALVRGASFGLHPIERSGRRHALLLLAGRSDGFFRPASFGYEAGHLLDEQLLRRSLFAARRTADEANRAKSDFLASMSHEIRTPMNGVIGMTELALDLAPPGEQREFLRSALSSADNLLAILNDILDLSKIEAGRMELENAPLVSRELLSAALDPLALRAGQKGLELACRVHPDTPPCLLGDAGRLRQIVNNLVSNAVKFTEKGEVVVELRSETRESGPVLLLSVRDTGIGIPEHRRIHLFKAFTQADPSIARRFGGTGLGLSISASLVRQMGGRISVESEEGRGSVFLVELPLRACEAPPPDSTSFLLPEPSSLAGRRCLVVDDNATNLTIVTEMLRAWGAEVVAAVDSESALARVREIRAAGGHLDLALVDEIMPGGDGFALIEALRQLDLGGAAPLIMLSSGDGREEFQRCRALGVPFLRKPVFQAQLWREIAGVLALRGVVPPAGGVAAAAYLLPPRLREVLLVEDVPVNQVIAVRLLSRLGARVTVVESGEKALRAWSEFYHPLVFMDLQMPGMGGLEATRLLRSAEAAAAPGRRTLIIALTACAMEGDAERCTEAGMDGYLTKPFRLAQLVAVVSALAPAEGAVDAA
jgi:signal transduction histidine kinase/DNA-binding response OmpR family regulator